MTDRRSQLDVSAIRGARSSAQQPFANEQIALALQNHDKKIRRLVLNSGELQDLLKAITILSTTDLHVNSLRVGTARAATDNEISAGFISVDEGGSLKEPSAGDVRIAADGDIRSRNDADTADIRVIVIDSTNDEMHVFADDDVGQINIGTTGSPMELRASLSVFEQATGDNDHQFRSTGDVAHGMTSIVNTGAYGMLGKADAGGGGFNITGLSEQVVGARVNGYSTSDNSTKTSAGRANIEMNAAKKSGTSVGNVGANANIWAARMNTSTRFIIDEDGDYHYDGADGGAFDEYNDALLLRAFSKATSAKGIIKDRWDRFVNYGESDLVDAGILGAPVAEGGLVNGAQLQRLHTGALWQMFTTIQEQAERIEALEAKLLEA